VALAASTGGPEVLRTILTALPEDVPGLVVVQHMPRAFTRAFARRLDSACALSVSEAEDGEPVEPGRALVAPGGRHLEVRRTGEILRACLSDGPPVGHHRPSADLFFRSVATAAGPSGLGVLLTGMGQDGAAGLLEMRRAGATTLAQDEASSVVFGMPGRAVALGAACHVVGLDAMAVAITAFTGLREARR
jgi:two-component system chemotaxis response regulator CheB